MQIQCVTRGFPTELESRPCFAHLLSQEIEDEPRRNALPGETPLAAADRHWCVLGTDEWKRANLAAVMVGPARNYNSRRGWTDPPDRLNRSCPHGGSRRAMDRNSFNAQQHRSTGGILADQAARFVAARAGAT